MNLNTLKRYAKKASAQVAKSDDMDLAGKRMAGSVRALQKIMVLEPYDSLSSLNNIFRKWGKL
jgi:hypothetical protein